MSLKKNKMKYLIVHAALKAAYINRHGLDDHAFEQGWRVFAVDKYLDASCVPNNYTLFDDEEYEKFMGRNEYDKHSYAPRNKDTLFDDSIRTPQILY